MSITDEIKRLHELQQSGALTDEEFTQAKARLLSGVGSTGVYSEPGAAVTSPLSRFRRSRTDQWLGGICGGLGKFTGTESWVWRLVFVLCTLYFGVGLFAYLLGWIFIPEEA